jgi:23S rRNA pseudouridine1911/1915/1917 synthase
VHPTARYYRNTVIKILEAERPGAFLSLVHRIDRETSGVLLLGKTPEADRALKMQLEARTGVEKRYLAVTWGVPEGSVPAGPRGAGEPFRCDRSMKLDPTSPTKVKMCVADDAEAMHASTVFQVLETRTAKGGRAYALVQCDLETGRQHQIRLHLASLGAPIVGDKLYGPDERLFARAADGELTEEDGRLLELPRHALHATRLSLAHPASGERFAVESPLPEDLARYFASV